MDKTSPEARPDRRRLIATLATLPAVLGSACTLRPLRPPAVEPASAPAGAPLLRPPRVGQSWKVRQLNLFNSATLDTLTERLTAVDATGEGLCTLQRRGEGGQVRDDEIHEGWGQLRQDPVWEQTLQMERAVPLWPTPLQPGPASLVHTHYRVPGDSGRYAMQVWTRTLRWERVTVPAGQFVALRVERLLRVDYPDASRMDTQRSDRLWVAPEVGRWVLRETSGRYLEPSDESLSWRLEDHHRWELVDWA